MNGCKNKPFTHVLNEQDCDPKTWFDGWFKILRVGCFALMLGAVSIVVDVHADEEDEENSQSIKESQQTNEVEDSDKPNTTQDSSESEDEFGTLFEDVDAYKTKFTSLAEILSHEATETDYPTTRNCLDSRRIREYEILSERFVVVYMSNKQDKYVIQFDRKCGGMTTNSTLRFDTRRGSTMRICANDTIRPTIANEWGHGCRIPGFEPVNDVQLEQLTRGVQMNLVD